MSFGNLFIPEDEKLKPNIYSYYNELIDSEIRSNIKYPSALKDKHAKNLGRLYGSGVDSPNVLSHLYAKQKSDSPLFENENETRNASSPKNQMQKSKKPFGSPIQELNQTKAIILGMKSDSGKYHVKSSHNNYEVPLQSSISSSSFNMNTPKMWPSDTLTTSNSKNKYTPYDSETRKIPSMNTFGTNPHSQSLKSKLKEKGSVLPAPPLISSRPCSKAGNNTNYLTIDDSSFENSGISLLQQTLMECGRLKLVGKKKENKIENQIRKAIKIQKKNALMHARWLRNNSDKSTKTPSPFSDADESSNSSLISYSNKSLKSSTNRSNLVDPSTSSSMSSLGNMEIETAFNSRNPFRKTGRASLVVSYARTKPRQVNRIDPLDYGDDIFVKTMGHFNACIKPDFDIGSIPSQKEVTKTLMSLARKELYSYNTKIVECGSALKALKDPRHDTPGLQAILDLHKAFINAATMNPNGWLLKRKQLLSVFKSKLPWMPEDSVNRLLLSFDPQNTGMIRYIRITTTLIATLQPAMINLASTINRVRNKVYRTNVAEDMSNYLGDLVLISFIHNLYEQCNGEKHLSLKIETQEPSNQASSAVSNSYIQHNSKNVEHAKKETEIYLKNVGMRLEDIKEAFSCCATCIDDEIKMEKVLNPLIDSLFSKKLDEDHILAKSEKNSTKSHMGHIDELSLSSKISSEEHSIASNYSIPSVRKWNSFKSDALSVTSSLYKGGNSLAWSRKSIHGADENSFDDFDPNTSSINANSYIKFPKIKDVRPISNISQDELLDTVKANPAFIHEFVRQVNEFRQSALPFSHQDKITIDDSINQFSSKYNQN